MASAMFPAPMNATFFLFVALDMAGAKVSEVVYIENTEMFVDVAQGLGVRTIFHKDYETTVLSLAEIGLELG